MILENAYIDGLQVHGSGATDYGLFTVTLGSPGPRQVLEHRPSQHGATDSTAFYGPRTLELVGKVQTTDFSTFGAALDELLGSLVLGSLHTFKFRRLGDAFDLQATVRVDSAVDLAAGDDPAPFARWGVSLLAPDPRLYASTVSVGDYDPTTSGGGGLMFPLEFPLVFGVGGAAGLSVTNEGTISTPVTLVATGPVTNPIFDNDTAGLSIYTTGCALASGDTLTLDTQARTALLNGTTLRPDLIDTALTTWWEVVPGVNLLRLRGSGMSSGQTSLQATYRSARI